MKKIFKDIRIRNFVHKYEKKINVYKYMLLSERVSLTKKYSLASYQVRMITSQRSSKIRNRCVLTGRGRGVLSRFKLSRHSFKRLVNSGFFAAIRKGS